ncbi:aminotransferase class V-fold PLP-dependent enzyme [Streptomyces sp. bgisy034]|uniref:aminotransferase class V-fold PLP-dependent enzyme n=1 Tax=Streptomyces sp. bgisy034 TaxID=3413774 RepID=UPI003EBF030D
MTPSRTDRQVAAVIEELAEWQRALRAQFPIITAHPELAYLDSAATAQKPQAVLDAVHTYLTTTNANAGRGTYPWANRTTALVEEARDRVRLFLADPAPERSTVHFTSGTTEGLRGIARDWLPRLLTDGDEIVVPVADHEANIAPWLEAQRELAGQGVHIHVRPMPYQPASGDYDHTALAELAGPRIRFVAVSHVHHVYGADMFSGHKAMALPGTGVVWARRARGPKFAPGGWAGTPNTVGIASLTAALDWLDAAGTDRIERWTVALAARLTEGLRRLDAYEILGCQASLAADSPVQRRQGIVTLRHHAIDSSDLGFILFSHGFMVRSDQHCQGGAGEKTGSVRVSLHVHNTVEEVDRLLTVLASLG